MKLYLTDENNDRIDLLGETGIWLTDVTGMGAEAEEEHADLSHGFFSVTKDRAHPQQTVNGNLIFTGEGSFAAWQSFADRLLRAKRLFIAAAPVSDGELFYREVRLRYLQKGDRKRNYMTVPASFTCLTPWYKPQKLDIHMQTVPADVARFGQVRFGQAVFAPAYDRSFTADIPAEGHLPAAIDFSFTGSVDEPVLLLRGAETGTVYMRCAVSATLSGSDRLEYSSDPRGAYVRKVSGGVVTDLNDLITPSADPYAPMPVSEPCILTFDGDGDPEGSATASVRYYYRSI